jgi:hypothetical protein
VGHATCRVDMRNAYGTFVRESGRKSPIGRLIRRS